MSLAGALVCVVLFGLLLHLTRIVTHSRSVIDRSREAMGVIRNPALDDDDREQAFRRISGALFVLMARLVIGAVVSLGTPLLVVWLGDQWGLLDFGSVMAILAEPWFLVATVVIAIPAYRLITR